ncbi:MAG: potassium channel family protein [Blautia sp.]
MKEKSYAVIGLGQFGMSVAETLAESDCDVLAIDAREENIQEIADKVTYAVRADVREPEVLRALGVQNVDVAVIAVAENMEASIMATMQAKELGVPYVLAKAMNALHGKILEKIGADRVIYPEQSMGLRVARNLMSGGFLDVFELSTEFSMAEFPVPTEWIGKSLQELQLRESHDINIIAIKVGDDVEINLDPVKPLEADWHLMAIGKNKVLERLN